MAVKNESGLWQEEIDGSQYEFTKWGAEDATDTLLDLIALVGKPLGLSISKVFGGEGMDQEATPDMIGMIMDSLSERIGTHKAMVKVLIKKLGSENVLCDGKKVAFNSHYQDRLDHLFRVVKVGLEVQYGNFLGAILGSSGQKMAKGLINRASQMSSGPSGGPSQQV